MECKDCPYIKSLLRVLMSHIFILLIFCYLYIALILFRVLFPYLIWSNLRCYPSSSVNFCKAPSHVPYKWRIKSNNTHSLKGVSFFKALVCITFQYHVYPNLCVLIRLNNILNLTGTFCKEMRSHCWLIFYHFICSLSLMFLLRTSLWWWPHRPKHVVQFGIK